MRTIKRLLLPLLFCAAAFGQQVTISDTLTNAVGGGDWTGRITITLNSPGQASYGSVSLSGWQYVLCVGVTGSDCSATTAAGVITIPIYATTTLIPTGLSYTARYAPTRGTARTETWEIEPTDTELEQIISSVVPTPTTLFQESQLRLSAGALIYGASTGLGTELAPGTNGHYLKLVAGYPVWAAVSGGGTGCATWDQCSGGTTWDDLQ